MINNNETIDDEVLRILREALRPLSLNAITDRSDLFDGPAPVALSINRLVARGALHRAPNDNGGKQLYTLRDAVAPPEEPAPVTPDAVKASHGDLILAALREAGQLTRTQAAEAAGCSPKRASDVLGILKARGLANLVRPGLWAVSTAGIWTGAAPQKPAAESGPAVEKPPSKPADQPAGNQDTEAPPPTPIIARGIFEQLPDDPILLSSIPGMVAFLGAGYALLVAPFDLRNTPLTRHIEAVRIQWAEPSA